MAISIQATCHPWLLRTNGVEVCCAATCHHHHLLVPRINQLFLSLSSHGSNVVGLQTTATFDEATDEFIINSPDITVCNGRGYLWMSGL